MKLLARLFHACSNLRWRIIRPITVGVRVILENDSAVLLVRHTYLPQWYLPGGGVKRGETLEQAVRREAQEETGATVGELRLAGAYSNFYEHKSDHIIVFACKDFTLTGERDAEVEACQFFRFDELPADVSPGTTRRIHEYVNNLGDAPTVGPW